MVNFSSKKKKKLSLQDEQQLSNTNDAFQQTNHHRYISTDGQHMRIISSRKTDSGRYTCLAQNMLGVVKKVFNVEVYGNFVLFYITT